MSNRAHATSRGTTKSLGIKDQLDKFYTRPEVAKECLARLTLDRYSRIIEPSAGAGAFSELLFSDPISSSITLAFDIAPEHPRVTQQDWLKYSDARTDGPILVVGNPPFGRQHSLALRFINHAFSVVGAQTVAFILPRGFRKHSTKLKVRPLADLTLEFDLPDDAFLLHGRPYALPTVFQVWERADRQRKVSRPKAESRYVQFVDPKHPHDFVVRRVGGRAGKAAPADPTASPQSNYFLRLTSRKQKAAHVEDVINLINGLKFTEADHTTGPRSVSKPEFVRRFDRAYKKCFET